jgi:hypothetical protein
MPRNDNIAIMTTTKPTRYINEFIVAPYYVTAPNCLWPHKFSISVESYLYKNRLSLLARAQVISTDRLYYLNSNRSASGSCFPVINDVITSAPIRLKVMPFPPKPIMAKQFFKPGIFPIEGKLVVLVPNVPAHE